MIRGLLISATALARRVFQRLLEVSNNTASKEFLVMLITAIYGVLFMKIIQGVPQNMWFLCIFNALKCICEKMQGVFWKGLDNCQPSFTFLNWVQKNWDIKDLVLRMFSKFCNMLYFVFVYNLTNPKSTKVNKTKSDRYRLNWLDT